MDLWCGVSVSDMGFKGKDLVDKNMFSVYVKCFIDPTENKTIYVHGFNKIKLQIPTIKGDENSEQEEPLICGGAITTLVKLMYDVYNK